MSYKDDYLEYLEERLTRIIPNNFVNDHLMKPILSSVVSDMLGIHRDCYMVFGPMSITWHSPDHQYELALDYDKSIVLLEDNNVIGQKPVSQLPATLMVLNVVSRD